jgi:3-phosphoshikimate 1-carboxyvinyltransferase
LSSITVKKNNLFPFDFDAKDTPDLVPYLAILAANCKGKSMIHNVTRLNLKESRRLDLIMKNLSQMSINCELKNDTLEIWSGKIQGGIFETGNDHRMSMAGALASLTSSMEIIIDNQDCVKKSYPYFWNDIKSVSKKLY